MSFAGSCGSPGSVYSPITPSPFVSTMVGHQPWAACSSPVSSYSFVFSQPTTSVDPLSQRVSFSSSANCRWWVM